MKLQLDFNVERRLGNPQVKIQIDDFDALYKGDCSDSYEFDVKINVGEHNLKITHYNKTMHDHKYNENNEVIIDKHIELCKIYLDDVELYHRELMLGQFWPVYEFNADTLPPIIKENLYLGHNGMWKLQFFYPSTDWLIKCREDDRINLDGSIFKTSESLLSDMKDFFNDDDLPEV